MVTRRIRSEYMKKFKDPKWESYSKCYEELLKYRRTRRLLEQSHNPWFWEDCTSDASESGKSTPQSNKVEPLQLDNDALSSPCDRVPQQQPVTTTQQASTHHPDEQEGLPSCGPLEKEPEVQEGEEERGISRNSSIIRPENEPEVPAQAKSHKQAGRKSRSKSQPPKCQGKANDKGDKENKHPFALYGWGERQADIASRKTHNVRPSASTKEIHESALRAKTRREVEKHVKKVDMRRARSVDLEKMAKSKIVPSFDPWMTEYMRCFSVRSR